MNGTAEVIQISAFRKAATASPAVWGKPQPVTEPQTETGRNYRLRQKRRHDWWVADARREYWRVARKMEDAISFAKRAGLPEGQLHPGLVPLGVWDMVAKYREAIMAQLLTRRRLLGKSSGSARRSRLAIMSTPTSSRSGSSSR